MALSDLVKTIYVAFKTDGADEVKRQIQEVGAEADAAGKRIDFTAALDDRGLSGKLDLLKVQFRLLRDTGVGNVRDIAAAAKDLGDQLTDDGRKAEALALRLRLLSWQKTQLGLGGAGGGGGGGFFSALLGGGGGLAGGGALAVGGAGGVLSFLSSPLGIVSMAAAAGPVAALVVTSLGGLVGGGAAFGALRIASTANTNLTALQANVTTAQQAYQQALIQQQYYPSAANAAAVANAQKALLQAQGATAAFQRANAPALNLYNAGQNVISTAGSVVSGALMRNGAETVTGRVGTSSLRGDVTQQTPGSSFFASLGPVLAQINAFLPTLGPSLAQMFRASEPYVTAFVKIFEGFAVRVIPAVTSALNHFARFLPDVVHVFNGVSAAIGGVIRAIGWLADKFGWLMQKIHPYLNEFIGQMKTVGHDIKNWTENVVAWNSDMHKRIEQILGFIERGYKKHWDQMTHDISQWAGDVGKWVGSAVKWFVDLPGRIINALAGLEAKMFTAGQHAVQRLIDGLGSMVGSLGSMAGRLAAKVAGFFGLSPAIEGPLSGGGAPEVRGRHFADALAAGMMSRTGALAAAAHGSAYAMAAGTGSAAAYARPGGAYGGTVRVQLEVVGSGPLVTALKQTFRVRGGQPGVTGL